MSKARLDIATHVRGLQTDWKGLKRKVGAGVRRSLIRFGSFVRMDARRSLRTSVKKTSSPGDPPFVRAKSPLKKMIFFAYEPFTDGVVIGPLEFRNAKAKMTPKRLEYGGTHRITSRRTGRRRVVKYAPRPFMRPAFEQVIEKHRDLFKDIL